MMSPASSAVADEETQIDYEKEMAMASVRGGRGKALPWTSMDTAIPCQAQRQQYYFQPKNQLQRSPTPSIYLQHYDISHC